MKLKKSSFKKDEMSQSDFETILNETFGENNWIKREQGRYAWQNLEVKSGKPCFIESKNRFFKSDYSAIYGTDLWKSLSNGRYLLGSFHSNNGFNTKGTGVLYFESK